MNEILLSIVIPTKNRSKYIKSFLRSLSITSKQNFEIIVHDNSDTNNLEYFVNSLNDQRVNYFYTNASLNMHENCDKALEHCHGKYVTLIGDDDGILIDKSINLLSSLTDIKCVISNLVSYSWPGVHHRVWGDIGGPTSVTRIHNSLISKKIPTSKAINEVFARGSGGGLGYLPRLYQGFVRKDVIELLKNKYGTCFPGASPDMSNSIALTYFIKEVYFSKNPLIIAGHCPKSGGAQGSSGKHHSEIKDATHIPAESVENWSPFVPDFWSGTTVYAQSIIDAINSCDKEPNIKLKKFNYLKLYAYCIVYEPSKFRARILKCFNNKNKRSHFSKLFLLLIVIKLIVKRSLKVFTNLFMIKLRNLFKNKFINMEDVIKNYS